MDTTDVRKKFVLASIGNFFELPLEDPRLAMVADDGHLDDLLDSGACLLLAAFLPPAEDRLVLSNKVNSFSGNEKVIVFFKTEPTVITEKNYHDVLLVSSMLSSPVSSLYHALQTLYAPMLLEDSSATGELDPKLQKLMTELSEGLGSMVRRAVGGSSDGLTSTSLAGILSVKDEVQYWKDASIKAKSRHDKEMAKEFYEILEPLGKDFSVLESVMLAEAEEVLENCQNALDDLWQQDFPQQRMAHLLNTAANQVARYVQSRLGEEDFWKGQFSQVEKNLQEGMAVCDAWVDMCQKLTGMFWKASEVKWEGPPLVPDYCKSVSARLMQILNLRMLHRQLTRLLTPKEQEELNTDDAFKPFVGLKPVHYNPYTEPLWQAAVRQFENSLKPAEQRISGKLREQLSRIKSGAYQLMQEFKRYKELIKRDSMKRELIAERELLLGQLSAYIQKTGSDFSTTSVKGPRRLPDVPEMVSNIYWVKPLKARILDIKKTATELLSELSGYDDLVRRIDDLCQEMDDYHSDQFDTWSREMLQRIKTQELSLATEGQVLSFGAGRLLQVSYNKRLVGLIQEVMHLSLMGNRIHPEIVSTAKHAEKFLRQAKALEEIANFHNTIGDQMIPSQRPMMLEAAKAFTALVNKQNGVTWSNTAELDDYIKSLKAATHRLARENKELAKCHLMIKQRVLTLMNTDLLRRQDKWKELLKEMRSIMHQLSEKGFKDQKSWCAHWDRQLYKALEHQYQLGIEALNSHLPEIKVELTYRQQRLQFVPPMEEISMKYYSQLKRFLGIPNVFKGVSEVNENPIFPVIVTRNAHRFGQLFQRATQLFARLEAVKDRFVDLVALGAGDIEEVIEKECQTADDWDRGVSLFKRSKANGQEIGKIPGTEEKIECMLLGFQPLRVELEILNRRYWDLLVQTLSASVIRDTNTIEHFANDAIQDLKRQPQTVDEIADAQQKYKEHGRKTEEMMVLFAQAEKKNKTLAIWTKEKVEKLSIVSTLWDNFVTRMENHEQIITKQVESIKNNLESQTNNFNDDISKFGARWRQFRPTEDQMDGDAAALESAITKIKEKREEWDLLMETRDSLRRDFEHFSLPEPDFPELDEIESDLEKHEQVWGQFDEFRTSMEEFRNQEWIVFRSKTYKFEEFLTSWSEKQQTGEASMVRVRLLQELEKYHAMMPVLKYVRGEVFSEKHWMEMYTMIGLPQSIPIEQLTFGDIMKCRDSLVQHADALKELNNRAAGEVVVRQALGELDLWEVEAKFTLVQHTDSKNDNVSLIKEWKDIINKVGDHQSLLQSLKDSSYFGGYADRARVWEQRLADLDEYLANLNHIQRKWVYLEPIFGRGALPQEQGRFRQVDADFKTIMADVARDSRVVSLCRVKNIRTTLTNLQDQLARCQKSLNEFLEEKRSAFPRFYFIGDDDLLEILGQSTNVEVIQSHLKKLFAGIHSVDFDDDNSAITGMKSLEGEVVPLDQKVPISSHVEEWLAQLSDRMKSTLSTLLKECLSEASSQGNMDPLRYPAQVLCLADAILFTERCEEAIKEGGLSNYNKELQAKLESYTSVEMTGDDDDREMHVLGLKLKALILDTIHNIEVVDKLMAANTTSLSEWTWQQQLRFYMGPEGTAKIRMVDAEFDYTYEYQGNVPKLVHTPLTDKCYLTLTQGMHMGLGGNPYGPAGTGKTESVKALGGLFGRQVLVFNCDEGIDVKSMGRIFVGLVKCGAWGCFDEFNRLEEAVLSAVSMQIQTIQAAIKNRASTTTLLEKEIPVDLNSGIFITMNPAGKGYGGRQKLPDNLKQLFRPVAMSRPDNDLIAEVILYSEGFKSARSIGRKLVAVFTLSKELLTQQQHYDWGLRALKTVLKGSGNLLQQLRSEAKEEVTAEIEAELVVQALRLNTLSKLTFADSVRFDELVYDVFTNVPFRGVGFESLAEVIKETFSENSLVPNERQTKKCLELYEQLQQRMGVVVVGPSGSGKTTLWRMLFKALTKMGQNIKTYVMNPKAMTRHQLLGHIDHDTREWSDGVLTASARLVVKEPVEVKSWIVCDGDIDPEWIESLNSVLDDNRLLTMPSGERIQFGPNVNFLFETHDLSCASPATISRMGMIFLSEEDTNVELVVDSWLNERENDQDYLAQYIKDYFFRGLEWVMKQNESQVDTTLVGWVFNGLSHMTNITSRTHFAVALIRGLGGNLLETTRADFAREVYSWVGEHLPDSSRPLNVKYDEARDRLESYTTDTNTEVVIDNSEPPLVLTADSKRILDYIFPWLQPETQQPFILIGPEGCGKSKLLHHCFSQLRGTQVAVVHCSAYTAPHHILQKLTQMCMVISTNTGRVYRPKDCERLILYLKDLNLPKPDKWGTCQLITFLQQLVTHGGFYDSSLEWVGLEGVQVVGSLTGGSALGRHKLSTRFTSVVRIASMGYPEREQLVSIYSSYCAAVVRVVAPEHPVWQNKAPLLAASMVHVYDQVSSSFSVDDFSHYLFTPRDLTRWVLGLLRYTLPQDDSSLLPLLRVWLYEACRMFRDKLAEEEDLEKFDRIVLTCLQNDWNTDLSDMMNDNTFFTTAGVAAPTAGAPLPPNGHLLGLLDEAAWAGVVTKALAQYTRDNRDLVDLLIFQEVLETMARVDRVLTAPGGSLLMAGRSGVGRRTALTVMANWHSMKLVSPAITVGYSISNFRNDIKQAMEGAGVAGEQVVLLIEDHHLVSSDILETVNSLLMAGEVPGLYKPEELEPLLLPLKDQAAHEGFRGSQFAYFSDRVRRNLHIALLLDNSSTEFSVRCESNPALYKQCAVLWMEGWHHTTMLQVLHNTTTLQVLHHTTMLQVLHHTTMLQVPELLLTEEEMPPGDAAREEFIANFPGVHESLPASLDHLVTPRRYMALLHAYHSLYTTHKNQLSLRTKHLQDGVSKLHEAQVLVDELKQEASVQEKELAEKQAEANKALQQISDTMSNANTQKVEMESLKEQTLKEGKHIAKRKVEIDAELAEIEPLVREAKEAVGNIKSDDLSEVRSLRAPPEVIRDILEGVLTLMGIRDTSWNSMKSFLAKRGVKDEIKNYDPRNVSPEARRKVESLLKEKAKSFTPAVAKRASTTAAPLAAWVSANVKFSYVLEKVKPLEAEQHKLEKNLQMAETKIGHLSSGLESVESQVSELKEKLNKSTKEAAKVELQLAEATKTITAAESLVTKLDSEYRRWSSQVSELEESESSLSKQCLLAAAFITYLSEASEDVRKSVMDAWTAMLGLQSFDLTKFLASERELLQWKTEGLPSDDLSAENALVILQNSEQAVGTMSTPLLIDPSSRATDWLQQHLGASATVEITSQQDQKFVTALELAVRFGKTLIVEEVDSVSPVLYPLLRADLVTQGPRHVLQLGDKQLDYNERFRLFLATRRTQLNLPPDAAALLTTVNFTTTRAGLTGQLLALTLQAESPELEVRRSELVSQEETLRVQLANLEEQLLTTLAQSEGNILENKELLASLEQAKSSAATIESSLTESMGLQETLEQERASFLPLAKAGAALYFNICDLSKQNNMYRFSLAAFITLFNKALQIPKTGQDTTQRLAVLQRALVDSVYSYVARSLFKADRLMFAMHMVHGMHPDLFQKNEWEVFTGLLVSEVRGSPAELKETLPKWIDSERAFQMAILQKSFPALFSSLQLDDAGMWSSFMRSSHSETDFPAQVSEYISTFQRVLVVQALRPDRLESAMINFASKILGVKELSPGALNLRHLVPETIPTEPILLIISPGADPSQELLELVKATVTVERYEEVAMGQGQSEVALHALQSCASSGRWLCLKNLHLVTAWLPVLEKELNSLQPHQDFRLWLTAEPHPKFTAMLLQSSLKITYEAPAGLKKNLQRTMDSWSPEMLAKGNTVSRAQALFVLAWTHAVLQERRTYIPQGWSKFYEFSYADLRAGADIIDRLYTLAGGGEIKWDFIIGLFENAIYGGRVDNVWDLRVLQSYLSLFFSNEVIGGKKPPARHLAPNLALPTTVNYQDYYGLVTSLPEDDQPDHFGLPANIERSRQRMNSSRVIHQLKVLMRSEELVGKFDKEKWRLQLSPVLNSWKKLNQGSSLLQKEVGLPSGGSNVSPVTAFVQLEQYHAIQIVQAVHRSLAALSKVIRGTLLLTSEVQKLADSLLKQETPSSWHALWEGPDDPLEYLRSLVRRARGAMDWAARSDIGALLKESLDLSDTLHPGTFLNALRQQTAREYEVAMDELTLVSSWSRGGIPDARLPLRWAGLQLEGASFDGSRLMTNTHDSPSITTVPPCVVAWLPKNKKPSLYQDEQVAVPVYSSSLRESVVCSLDVPCSKPRHQWVQAGIALLLTN
ncbi:ATPase dynein-related AAA domain [Trinorchestia longiramus]|nr:ATPase dynein-related AAA domain [Trinorchestia longiramus]